MGAVIIEIPEKMNIRIRAKDFIEAIAKLNEIKETRTNTKIDRIRKFKGIAKSNVEINKEEWYLQ